MMISYDCGFKTSILLEILILFKKMNKARDSGTMNIMAGESLPLTIKNILF